MDAWDERDQRIEVVEGEAIGLRLRAKVEGRPSMIYEILTDPNCVDVFRNIKVSPVAGSTDNVRVGLMYCNLHGVPQCSGMHVSEAA